MVGGLRNGDAENTSIEVGGITCGPTGCSDEYTTLFGSLTEGRLIKNAACDDGNRLHGDIIRDGSDKIIFGGVRGDNSLNGGCHAVGAEDDINGNAC